MENQKFYHRNGVLTLQKIKITRWENYKEGTKYRRGWIEIPILIFETPSEIDKKIPSGSLLQTVKLKFNTTKNFVVLVDYKTNNNEKDKLLEEITTIRKEIHALQTEIKNLKKEQMER